MTSMQVSIVIPCYNNQYQLFDTVSRVVSACATVEPEIEVLLIDDNSRDETWSIIQQLASQFSAVSGFKLKVKETSLEPNFTLESHYYPVYYSN